MTRPKLWNLSSKYTATSYQSPVSQCQCLHFTNEDNVSTYFTNYWGDKGKRFVQNKYSGNVSCCLS